MSTSSALDSFLDKWRTRWPEWQVAERFVPERQRTLVVAWFSLLQEFDDIFNTAGDPMPSDAKLAWWGEELRSWSVQRSRHPLGRVLEPVRAPWAQLAETLPDLIEARAVPVDPAQALRSLQAYAAAVAAVEAVMFQTPARGDVATPVLVQTLAQRLHESGVAAIPRSLLAEDDSARHAGGRSSCWRSGRPGSQARARAVCTPPWRAPGRRPGRRTASTRPRRCVRCGWPGGRRAADCFWWVRTLVRTLCAIVPTRIGTYHSVTSVPAPAADRCGYRTSSCPNAGAARSRGRSRPRRQSPDPAQPGRQPSRRYATGAGSSS